MNDFSEQRFIESLQNKNREVDVTILVWWDCEYPTIFYGYNIGSIVVVTQYAVSVDVDYLVNLSFLRLEEKKESIRILVEKILTQEIEIY